MEIENRKRRSLRIAGSVLVLALYLQPAPLIAQQTGPHPQNGGGAEFGDVPHTAAPPRLDADVHIDGVLDEPAWADALLLDSFHQYLPVDDRPSTDATEVLAWYAPTAIYFGVRGHTPPYRVRATLARPGHNLWGRLRTNPARHLRRPAPGVRPRRQPTRGPG